MSDRMAGILDVVAQALKPSSDPMPSMRSHPGDANGDLSALQLIPHIPKSIINDIAKYGTQAVTGKVSDSDLLYQPELTGDAKALSDMFGDAVGGALNYKNRGLLMPEEGLSVADMIGGAVSAYQDIKPGLIDRIGEANVNRAEGGGLLGAMLIPGQVSKVAPIDKFYSQAVRASGDLQRKQGNADGFFNDLTGKGQVKPDELNAMGFKENFAGRQDVSRQEVQQFVNDNQVQIKETLLSNAEGYRRGTKFGDYTLDGGDNYRELLLQDNSSAGLLDELNLLNGQMGEIKTPLLRNVTSDDALKKRYSDATIFGDMEIDEFVANEIPEYAALLSRRDELVKQKDNLPEPFINSSHFDEPNILAHLRMKDRVDADGNKTLLIEEAQSDWHQTGANEGYQKPNRRQEIKDEYERVDSEIDEAVGLLDAMPAGRDRSLLREVIGDLEERRSNLSIEDADMTFLVPDAPFKTDDKSSWYNLAMKRGLLEAVEGGYDKMAITTGRQQADRYDLSQQINEVRLDGDEVIGFTVQAFDKNDSGVFLKTMDSLDELPNLIGKDAAKALVDQPLTDAPFGPARVLAGQDLSIGGEGMKQFYDRTLPNTLNKLVKQDGVKVGQSELDTGLISSNRMSMSQEDRIRLELLESREGYLTRPGEEELLRLRTKRGEYKRQTDTVHSIDITPEMRERVKKGLPLFATAGAALGLTEMMSQQQQQQSGAGLFNGLQY